ncbi:MmgE/PrpD family protein [Sphingobium subterraneum]|uniref:MmgE/PrpD N-terminal domain-containing protein n=1 Tax=Sphingobium subterraneum TaxID=627688 RepID=A0A841J3Y6_9SPHN|nr:MmgE/PrpD family protein [Sphingobium subterraneum]MBB6122961.1 hypothetical protein [Sphingobium subterraneum]
MSGEAPICENAESYMVGLFTRENDVDILGVHEAAELAAFALSADWTRLPDPVRHAARHAFLDATSAMIAGTMHTAFRSILAGISPLADPPRVTVLGVEHAMDILGAAFMNAAGASLCQSQDSLSSDCRNFAVVAAALAVAEDRNATGAELLSAIAVALEAVARSQGRGYAATVGACTAAGVLLGLSEEQMRSALLMAAALSNHPAAQQEPVLKAIATGQCARNGILLAFIARGGTEIRSTNQSAAMEVDPRPLERVDTWQMLVEPDVATAGDQPPPPVDDTNTEELAARAERLIGRALPQAEARRLVKQLVSLEKASQIRTISVKTVPPTQKGAEDKNAPSWFGTS